MSDAVPSGPLRFPDADLGRYARLAEDAGLPLSIWLAHAAAAVRTGPREVQLALPLGDGGPLSRSAQDPAVPDERGGTSASGSVSGTSPGGRDVLDALQACARRIGRPVRLTTHVDAQVSLDRLEGTRVLSGGPGLAERLLETLRGTRAR